MFESVGVTVLGVV